MATEQKKRLCLIAVDGSKHSDVALNWFIKHVHKENDRTILITCVDYNSAFSYGVSMVPGNPEAISKAYSKEEKKATALLSKLAEEASKHGVKVETLKSCGGAWRGYSEGFEGKPRRSDRDRMSRIRTDTTDNDGKCQ